VVGKQEFTHDVIDGRACPYCGASFERIVNCGFDFPYHCKKCFRSWRIVNSLGEKQGL